MRALARDFLPNAVSIKREDFAQFSKTRKKPHAESGAQKNPRRGLTSTGIYAINLKLKYGGCSLGSTVLNL